MTISETYGQHRLEAETGGVCRFDVQLTNSRHQHNYAEACLVLSGSGLYAHGDREYALRPGDVFFAEPNVPHEISSFETGDLEIFFVSFFVRRVTVGAAGPEDALLDRFSVRHRVHAPGGDPLRRYLPLLDESGTGIARLAARQGLKFFTLGILETLSDAAELPEAELNAPDILLQALDFIDRNLHRRLPAAEVAAHVGLSDRTLRTHFRARLGSGVAEEINHRKMRFAAHRLLMGFTVSETAAMVGIDDPAQFTRSFARTMGTPPKRFQRAYTPGRIGRQTLPPAKDRSQA